jgi:hypothetical protein
MAAGKPIIASDMEEMRPYAGDEMVIARTRPEWVAAIDEAIAHDTPERALARQHAARTESWDHRVEQVSAIIAPLLSERERRASTGTSSATLLAGTE